MDQLIPAVPGGGLPSNVITQQSLDRPLAAQATPADTTKVADELEKLRFVQGYERIWGSTDYVTMIGLRFTNTGDAQSFVDFERAELSNASNTYVNDHSDIPGSFVYVISGLTRQGAKDVICEGIWFKVAEFAFETMTCGQTPAFASDAEALGGREYASVQSLLHLK